MTSEGRFVFDTNVLVSALLNRRSAPRQALDRALRQGKLLISVETIAELSQFLYRKGFDKYLTEQERIEFVTALVRDAILVDATAHTLESRDPKDNMFLELATTGSATCIVSGDNDLLVLHPFQTIPILTPRQFLEWDELL